MGNGRMFDRYIGIDYSGAGAPETRLDGLAVCCTGRDGMFQIIPTYAPNATRWTRSELAHWLAARLQEPVRSLVGIDHGFSFPIDYFDQYQLGERRWENVLEDFQRHWPTDSNARTVAKIREEQGNLVKNEAIEGHRLGDKRWFRFTDRLARASSSVFDFDRMQGNVAYSTHAGLTWLLHIRRHLSAAGVAVHFWPFDGWNIPEHQSVVVEVYPALWNWWFERVHLHDRGGHKHDAYSVSRWMWETDRDREIERYFDLQLTQEQGQLARTEGWIFGILGNGRPEPW